MKLRIVTLAALAAIAGQAQALTLSTIATQKAANNLLEVYVSGASALSATIGGLLTQNCVAGTLDTYVSDKSDAVAFPNDATDGASVKAYTCQLVSTNNDFGATFNGKYVVFQKSDQGGSGNGVFPVATNASLPYLSLTAADCTGLVCKSNGFTHKVDAGVSDVGPTGFNPPLNRPLAPIDFSAAAAVKSADFFQVKSVLQVVFGLAVSQPLYAALQAEQGLASTVRPSVSKTIAAAIMSNGYDVGLAWKPLLPTNAGNIASPTTIPANTSQVNVCRRVNGSGTQASANRFFLEYGSNGDNALTPSDNANNSDNPGVNALTEIGTAGAYVVYEGSSTSNLRDCLNAANDAGAFAIGHISFENAETAKWKFVKIDGVEGGRDNAKTGAYPYVFESTIQVSKNASTVNVGGVANVNARNFAVQFTTAASKADNFASLSAATQNGQLATPFAAGCPATFGSTAVGTASRTFCSRVSRPNLANVLTVAK